jgi:hypothetical protein
MSALPERFAEYIATLRDAGEAPSMSRYPGRLLDGFQRYIERAASGLERYWAANER